MKLNYLSYFSLRMEGNFRTPGVSCVILSNVDTALEKRKLPSDAGKVFASISAQGSLDLLCVQRRGSQKRVQSISNYRQTTVPEQPNTFTSIKPPHSLYCIILHWLQSISFCASHYRLCIKESFGTMIKNQIKGRRISSYKRTTDDETYFLHVLRYGVEAELLTGAAVLNSILDRVGIINFCHSE